MRALTQIGVFTADLTATWAAQAVWGARRQPAASEVYEGLGVRATIESQLSEEGLRQLERYRERKEELIWKRRDEAFRKREAMNG